MIPGCVEVGGEMVPNGLGICFVGFSLSYAMPLFLKNFRN